MLGLGKKVKKEEVVDFSTVGQQQTPVVEVETAPQIKPPMVLDVPLRIEIILQTDQEALYAEIMNFMYDVLSRYETVILDTFAVHKQYGTK